MKKIKTLIISAALAALCLTGCAKYTSHYDAICFVHSNTSHSAYMDFSVFNGTMVFTLDNDAGESGSLSYTASLEKGTAEVYCDRSGEKEKLFSLKAGDDLQGTLSLSGCESVYVIVETSGDCENGKLDLSTEK
ncbi:MAG: hypothetical protein IKN17_12310 [Ruminococcus sp.]|nr:hypothetical protein [Ruminococcus sp.]